MPKAKSPRLLPKQTGLAEGELNAPSEIAGYREFELDLRAALLEKLPTIFDGLAPVPLTQEAVNALPIGSQGVYMLLENAQPTYIGKTDAGHGFRQRLARHFESLSSRHNLNLAAISFKAVRVMVFTTVNVESTLIEHYIGKSKVAWQFSGFGSNDPGRRRDGQEPSRFDKQFPIDIDRPLQFIAAGRKSVLEILDTMKKHLPYTVRYETARNSRVAHSDLSGTTVDILREGLCLRDILTQLTGALPDGWVATQFHGRVILYKNATEYTEAVSRISR